MGTKYRISKTTGALMIGTALLIDTFEFFLTALAIGAIANWATWVVSWIIFPMWFLIKGASYTKNKKLGMGALVGMAIGLIPIINALPELTLVIWLNIMAVRKEDEEKFAKRVSEERKQLKLVSKVQRFKQAA